MVKFKYEKPNSPKNGRHYLEAATGEKSETVSYARISSLTIEGVTYYGFSAYYDSREFILNDRDDIQELKSEYGNLKGVKL